MVLLIIEYLFIIPFILVMCAICMMSIWGYLSTIFNKSSSMTKQGHMLFWGIGIPMGILIFIFSKDILTIVEVPTTLTDFKNEIIEDLKTIGKLIVGIAGGGILVWLGIGLLTICATPLYLLMVRISNLPFKRIKLHYQRLLRSIDFIESHEIDFFKLRCIDFKSINSLPFNFSKKFFINPRRFDRKREGKRYSSGYGTADSYKNIQEYSKESNWRNEVIINRVKYLTVFSNISTSKNMLKFQFLINYLYIPLTIIFSIIEYHFFNYLFCLPILYSCLYFFIKKKYPKDFKIEYYNFKTGQYYLAAVLAIIPGLMTLNYIVQTLFKVRNYDNDYLLWDLGFTLLIIIFILLSDLYDYILENFMNSIFCRILLNEKLFCYFYTLKCFEVHLEERVNIESDSKTKEEKWFYIKFNPDIDK